MPVHSHLKFDEVQNAINDALKKALMKAGEHLRAASLQQAPKRDGFLHGSSFVEQTTDDSVTVGYNTPYAARLHEHPEYNFSTDANPGAKGKYLEDPANEERGTMLDLIGKEIRSARNG